MKIALVSAQNYRCLRQLDLEIADYTALVGANGSGKSSILYALDWFFQGYDLEESDLTQVCGSGVADQVHVTVTFSDLSARDRRILGEYGRGDVAHFRRTWTRGQHGTHVTGRALQGPGFNAVRQAIDVTTMRAAYRGLEMHGLPGLAGNAPRGNILAALAEWEGSGDNHDLLVEVDNVDASHIFGPKATGPIRECIRLVLVPAATDMQSHLHDKGNSSALAELIGTVISDAQVRARDEWLAENRDTIRDLNERIGSEVASSVSAHTKRLNAKLKEIVPNARVNLVPEVPDWVPTVDVTIATSVTIDGSTNDIARQGHGIQRAVMISLFQALAPEAATGIQRAGNDGPDPELETETSSLIVCIEEPEIYQHPVRARSFARVLSELSNTPQVQVLIATHSPYFVSPSQFDSIRRFRMADGTTSPSIVSTQDVMRRAAVEEDAVRKTVQKRLPTTFSEGFFAEAVVLVEGDTDRVVLESLAMRLGMPFDERGISVLEIGGRSGLRIPHSIFAALEIPVYVVADGDADGSMRGTPKGDTPEEKAANRAISERSNRSSTEKLAHWLLPENALTRACPYVYGDPSTVTDKYTIWRDDLESELAMWPSFVTALDTLGGRLRHKNVLTYRDAVFGARIDDLPDTLRNAVGTILKFFRTQP